MSRLNGVSVSTKKTRRYPCLNAQIMRFLAKKAILSNAGLSGSEIDVEYSKAVKGTVQRELRWVKTGINRTARINCITRVS